MKRSQKYISTKGKRLAKKLVMNPLYRMRVVTNIKQYNRKRDKRIKEDE